MDGPLGFLGETSSVSWHMTSAEDCGPARRVVALPPGLLGDLRGHLTAFVAPDAGALVFTGPKGAALRRSNFQKCWIRALTAAGLDHRDLHFHDLRHTGNTLTAQSGATLPDLMARMGHASTRAASIYLHMTS